MHLDGKIETTDYERLYPELIAKRAHLQAAETPVLPTYFQRAAELSAKDELSRAELRQLVHLIVDRVEAPITIPGVTVRKGLKTLRRLANIHLKFPTASGNQDYVSGIYDTGFTGARRFVSAEVDPHNLIVERSCR